MPSAGRRSVRPSSRMLPGGLRRRRRSSGRIIMRRQEVDWTEQEVAELRALWAMAPEGEGPKARSRRLASLFARSWASVREKAIRLNLPGSTGSANSYVLPLRPLHVPWEGRERFELQLGYHASDEPHWVRCERIGRHLGRSALAVHLEFCRMEGKKP